MPAVVQAMMVRSFGLDPSTVRIRESARPAALGARAFTQGDEIHIAPDAFAPQSQRGRRLIGHELAHVVQQSQGRVQGSTGHVAGQSVHEDVALEREADRMAERAVAGERVVGLSPTGSPRASSTAQAVQLERRSIPIAVHFKGRITGEEFKRIADLQIFGVYPAPGAWRKVADYYEASDSPQIVRIDVSLMKSARSSASADLGVGLDDAGDLEGHEERAAKLGSMPDSADKRALYAEIDRRYWATTGTEPGTKIEDPREEAANVEVWTQIRDELLVEREFVANLPDKVQAILQYSPNGIRLRPSDYAQVVRIARLIARMEVDDLENYLRNASATDSLDEIERSVEAFLVNKDEAETQIDAVMELVADDESWDVDTAAAELDATAMFYLSLEERTTLIDRVSDGYLVGDTDEETLIRLLTSTPADQRVALIAWLESDGAAMLARLESLIDGSENKELYAAFRNLVFGAQEPEELLAKLESAKLLPWSDPGLIKAIYTPRFYYETVEYTDEGKIKVEYWFISQIAGIKAPVHYFEPDEIIGLYFHLDEDFAGASEGEILYMPAANLLSFKNEQFGRELALVADIGLLAAGGAGLLAKGGRLAKAVAALDTAIGATALVINSYRSDIAKTAGGRAFLEAWDTVNTLIAVYGLARVVLALPKALRRLRELYREFKSSKHGLDPGDMKALDDEAQALLREADAVAFEKRLEELRGRLSAEELQAFEKELEAAAGLEGHAERVSALAAIEARVDEARRMAAEAARGVHAGGGPVAWEAPDGRVFTDEAAYRAYLESGQATRKALPAAKGGGDLAAEQTRVASGIAEDPGPLLRGGTLEPRHQDLLTRLVDGGGVAKVGKREITATDLAALTKHSGREYAYVILKDNTRALVDVGSYKGGALPANTKRLLIHSHPEDWGSGMAKFISPEDVDALLFLNQRYSYMVTVDGTVYRFTLDTVPHTVGDVVRKFHPILGWVSPGT